MKFSTLRSVGHNISDSLADGNGFLINHCDMDLFGEIRRSTEGFLEVDFLTGTASGVQPSPSLARALMLYSEALPSLCEKHTISALAFRRLSTRYFVAVRSRHFTVTVEDQEGHRATDTYMGLPGARPKTLDPLGRIRRDRGSLVRVSSAE